MASGEHKTTPPKPASVWSCPITGTFHAPEDTGRPYRRCFCINCDFARMEAADGKQS